MYYSDLYLIVGYYSSSPKFRFVVHPDKLLTYISSDYFSLYGENGALKSISPSKQLCVWFDRTSLQLWMLFKGLHLQQATMNEQIGDGLRESGHLRV